MSIFYFYKLNYYFTLSASDPVIVDTMRVSWSTDFGMGVAIISIQPGALSGHA